MRRSRRVWLWMDSTEFAVEVGSVAGRYGLSQVFLACSPSAVSILAVEDAFDLDVLTEEDSMVLGAQPKQCGVTSLSCSIAFAGRDVAAQSP